MTRISGWTPCLDDPVEFDCADCAFGWLKHCHLRSDESLRDERAARWRRNQGTLNLSKAARRDIEEAALGVLRRQRMALPSPVLWRLMPRRLHSLATVDELERLLRFSEAFQESTPRMFQATTSQGPPPSNEGAPLGITSGRMLEELTYDSEPFASDVQTLTFKRFTGTRRAVEWPDRASGIRSLSETIDSLSPRVMRDQSWSISDVGAYAFTARKLPPPPTDPDAAADRRLLLESVIGLDLLQRHFPDTLHRQLAGMQEELVRRNLRLVAHQAHRYARGGFLRYADMFQEGCVGLLKALDKFDPFMGYEFSTYATWWIRQAITRATADQDLAIRLPVHVIEKVRAVYFAEMRLRAELRRRPLDDEVQAALPDLGTTVAKVRAVQATVIPLGDRLLGHLQRSEEAIAFDSSEGQMLVWWALGQLTPRENDVLQMRHGLGPFVVMTLQQVGDHLGITREGVRQVEARASRRLREILASEAPWARSPNALSSAAKSPQAEAQDLPRTRAEDELTEGGLALVTGPEPGDESLPEGDDPDFEGLDTRLGEAWQEPQ